MDTTERIIQEWRDTSSGEAYFSASRVQARLFDLYGEVADEGAKRVLEMWLTLTVQRDLFSSAEILELLDDLQARIGQSHPVPAR
ncbi:MAG: hypothetical protein M3P85_05125 [Actinomycetota bacterium]|nr:hypothetical protein [Actinomycetota bacterium]PLS75221.1 MAG: hypothetical protein CYG61_08715 [Actinomycetota bacterium]